MSLVGLVFVPVCIKIYSKGECHATQNCNDWLGFAGLDSAPHPVHLSVPELQDSHFTLMNISENNLRLTADLYRRDIEANGLPAKTETNTDRREVIRDSEYIFCMIRQESLEALEIDLSLALK